MSGVTVEWMTVAVSRAMETVVGDVPLTVRVGMLPAICTVWGGGVGCCRLATGGRAKTIDDDLM